MKEKQDKSTGQKPIYKKWWFWVIIVIVLAAIFGPDESNNEEKPVVADTPITQESQSPSEPETESIKFVVTDVRNDVTGRWRIASIAKNIEMKDYALDYYKEYFKSNDEIHAIVNFNNKTTTRISVIGNLLDVAVHEYVDKEEHDAKLLFGGMLLKEYHVNMDNGEIEEIQ